MPISTIRHDYIFDHARFTEPVHVVGVGGIGSYVMQQLLKMGCGHANELHAWDDDTVAPHNLANQAYVEEDVGMPKVQALARAAKSMGSAVIHEHLIRVHGNQPLSGVVIMCVDSMAARKTVWDTCIRMNPAVSLFIETRMDAAYILIHTLCPTNEGQVRQWERYWHPDEEATNQTAGCGGQVAVGPTASIAGDLAVWQLIRYAAIMNGLEDTLDNQIRMKMRPLELKTFTWQ